MSILKLFICFMAPFMFGDVTKSAQPNKVEQSHILIAVVDVDKVGEASEMLRKLRKKIERISMEYNDELQRKDKRIKSDMEEVDAKLKSNREQEQNLIKKPKRSAKESEALDKIHNELTALENKKADIAKNYLKLKQESEEKKSELEQINIRTLKSFEEKLYAKSQEIANKLGENVIILSTSALLSKSDRGSQIKDVTDDIIDAMNKEEAGA